MIEVAMLVKNGVPWDVALSLSEGELFGLFVIFRGFDGSEFDFDSQTWKSRT